LKDALLTLAKQNETQYRMLSGMLNELVALRETVRGLDPTFSDVLEGKRKRSQEDTKEVVTATLGLLNQIIARLGAGEVG